MSTRLAFLGNFARLTSLLMIAAALLAFPAQPGRAAEEQNGVINVQGTVQDEAGNHYRGILVVCWVKGKEAYSRSWTSDLEGKFVIPAIPKEVEHLSCAMSESETYRPWFSDVPIDSRGEVVLTLDLKVIPKRSSAPKHGPS
jgi:hypothetical protein